MNCAECKELLVGFLEGFIGESQRQAVSQHLKDCAGCKAELEKLEELQKSLIGKAGSFSGSDVETEVFNRILREQKKRIKQEKRI